MAQIRIRQNAGPTFSQNNLTFVVQMYKKKTHKPRYCEKEKDKAKKRNLLGFDNNGLVKPYWKVYL